MRYHCSAREDNGSGIDVSNNDTGGQIAFPRKDLSMNNLSFSGNCLTMGLNIVGIENGQKVRT